MFTWVPALGLLHSHHLGSVCAFLLVWNPYFLDLMFCFVCFFAAFFFWWWWGFILDYFFTLSGCLLCKLCQVKMKHGSWNGWQPAPCSLNSPHSFLCSPHTFCVRAPPCADLLFSCFSYLLSGFTN